MTPWIAGMLLLKEPLTLSTLARRGQCAGLAGGLGSSGLAFQLPAILYCAYFWDGTRGRQLSSLEIITCGAIILFGVFAAIVSTYVTIQQLVQGSGGGSHNVSPGQSSCASPK